MEQLMDNTFFAQWESFTKSAVDSGKELEALNMKLVEQVTQKQMELLSSALETGNQWFSTFGEHKALPELIAAQSKLASDYSSKLLAASRETGDLLTASRDDYKAWFEKMMKLLSEQTAAATAKPVAVRKAA
jgi:phasin family protein